MKLILSLLILYIGVALSAKELDKSNFLTPEYSFIDNSINYLNWNRYTEEKTLQQDFAYLELETGVGWKWGEFYSFFDIENPLSNYNEASPNDLRFVMKPIFDIYIQKGFALHIQDFYLDSKTFFVNNLLLGLSYNITLGSKNWLKPFVCANYQDSTYYSGFNGYMIGWTFNYNYKFFGESFNIFNWNEIEFARATESYQLSDGLLIGDSSSYGLNGALSLWWNTKYNITAGMQYRYAKYKLGSSVYQSGVIYTLKFYY